MVNFEDMQLLYSYVSLGSEVQYMVNIILGIVLDILKFIILILMRKKSNVVCCQPQLAFDHEQPTNFVVRL